MKPMKRKLKLRIPFKMNLKFVIIILFMTSGIPHLNNSTSSAQTSLIDSLIGSQNDTIIKCWPLSEAKLLVEYAELGFDYDSTVSSYKREIVFKDSIIIAQDIKLDASEGATEHLGVIIVDLQSEVVKSRKKAQLFRSMTIGTSATAFIFAILFLVK